MTDARALWQLLEPVHAVTYFSEQARAPVAALGVGGFWNAYVVARAAPLGPVGPAVVTAAFFGFHPKRAAAVLPEVWERLSPDQVLKARLEGATSALGEHAGEVSGLADGLWAAAQSADCAGRVLGAANQALERPDDPLARLWQAATTLREHRGDGHLAALVSHGIGPVEAMQLKVAAGESDARDLQLGRGWSDEDWTTAAARLEERGWVTHGALTAQGRAVRQDVEDTTDRAAAQPWSVLSERELGTVVDGLTPMTRSVWASGVVPATNPIGVGGA